MSRISWKFNLFGVLTSAEEYFERAFAAKIRLTLNLVVRSKSEGIIAWLRDLQA